ncbi:hypothetical protein, partial [Permianibacter aggregans]|uniref:hypothetical protein n=1 Tax=Permianibacter aggregans TaxID=1510150 RepID=UPI001B85ED55
RQKTKIYAIIEPSGWVNFACKSWVSFKCKSTVFEFDEFAIGAEHPGVRYARPLQKASYSPSLFSLLAFLVSIYLTPTNMLAKTSV